MSFILFGYINIIKIYNTLKFRKLKVFKRYKMPDLRLPTRSIHCPKSYKT